MRRSLRSLSLGMLVGLLGLLGGASPVVAAEPAREFLNALREAGYFDTALEYLDTIPSSSAVPVELKQVLQYERGLTLIEASKFTRDQAIRAKQLDEAQAALEQFIAGNKAHALSFAAQQQLGNVLVERAHVMVDRSKKSKDPAGDLKQAYDFYKRAHAEFDKTQKEIGEKLNQLPKDLDPNKDAKQIELREELRREYLRAQLLSAGIHEEMADALPPKSKEWTDTLTGAAKEYGELYDKYRTRLAGLYGRLYQGRCYQKLGNDKEALSYFTELLEEPDATDEVRTLKTKVLIYAIKSWSSPTQKKFAEAVDKGQKWVETIRPNEQREEDWVELRLVLAKAMKAYADELKAKDAAASGRQLAEARKLVKAVVSVKESSFQKEARDLQAELGVGPSADEPKIEPKNFAEAFEAGKSALEEMQSASLIQKTVPDRLKVETDAKIKEELAAQLKEANEMVTKYRDEAERLFQAALKFSNAETDIAQLNAVRYYLSYFNFLKGDYLAAAVLGEFVAVRYPDASSARQSAEFAMAAYLKLYAEVQEGNKGKPKEEQLDASFEADRVVAICEYISKTWPDQPEAQRALNTLIPFMIQTKQLDRAEGYLAKIPTDSPNRGLAELRIGQALWAGYLNGMKEVNGWKTDGVPAEVNIDEKNKELADIKAKAEKTLADGVKRMKAAGEVSATMASAVLSLSQIYVDTNQPAKAMAELEDKTTGALTLVSKNDPSTDRPNFAEETLKVALRAYIASLQSAKKGEDTDQLLAKAKAVMEELKKRTGDEGQDKLVRIYVGIARDLKSQIELAESNAAKASLSKGFEVFLEQVGQESKEFNLLNWVAETFRGMGEAFDSGKGVLNPEARTYYEKASAQYKRIFDIYDKDKNWITEKMAIQLRLNNSNCKRKLGDYAGAIADLESILKTNDKLVNVQVEAAYTYQEWGAAEKVSKKYYNAIMGGDTKLAGQKESLIWGWGSLQRKTANVPAFRDTFFEARLNLAKCRFGMGRLEKTKAKQVEVYEAAKRDVKNVSIVSPDYGGDTWRSKFDNLVREIQREMKQKETGLQEFRVQDAAVK